MDCSMPAFPVHHQLPKLAQTHEQRIGDTSETLHPLLSPSPPALIFPSIRVFSNESALRIRWPKYCNFSFSISLSNEYLRLISFRVYWLNLFSVQFSSVAQSCPTFCDMDGRARPPCPSPTPGAYSNSCPSNRWCHPTISSSVIPFYSCLQYFPASGYFLMSQFFVLGGQSIGVSASASVFPMNIQDWFPLGLTGLIL